MHGARAAPQGGPWASLGALEPARLRGGVRLNRLHVHEVVPPLTNHVLAQTSIFSIIPRAPDPVLTLIGLEHPHERLGMARVEVVFVGHERTHRL